MLKRRIFLTVSTIVVCVMFLENRNAFAQTTTATQAIKPSTGSTTNSTVQAPPRADVVPAMPQRGDTTQAIRIQLRTTVGVVELDLYRRAAPATVENFMRYIENGYWSGGIFHRTVTLGNQADKPDSVKIQVIQGAIGDIYRQYALPPIELETTKETGLQHLDGTISMARDEPNTAQYEFFICIGDQPALNFGGARNPDGKGFAAFGRVVKGMDVVKKIQQSKAAGQTLTPPILILSMRRK
jgi:peptidyl-prolyl cis-trans isomerase A (cyclophilin A)